MAELDLKAVEAEFLTQCGPCDFAMPGPCECPGRDYRGTMLDLVREVERLRTGHTQQAFAASQADLTRVEQERDTLREVARCNKRHVASLTVELEESAEAIVTLHREVKRLERERDEARDVAAQLHADLARARTELRTLRDHQEIRAQVIRERNAERRAIRQALGIDMLVPPPDAVETIRELRAAQGWIVARDGGRDCVRCEQEIRRGEAYELMPGVDELQHVHCPTPEPKES